MFLLVYVDDLLITRSDTILIDKLKEVLQKFFRLKDFGSLRYSLGLEVTRSSKGLVINQRKYAFELIFATGLSAAKSASTSLELN